MPQKKNPFLLEHVHGMVASITGAFVHAAAAMHATPFTNSIAVGTEAIKPVWSALRSATEITVLMRVMVAGAVPNPEAMLQRAIGGLTAATEFANRLVREHGLDFRTAHRIIGEAARAYVENGKGSFAELAAIQSREASVVASFADLNPASIVQSLEAGGGPASRSFENCWRSVKEQWAEHCRRIRMQKKHWEIAELNLQREIEAFLAASHATAAFSAADVR
jgi:argininosuccinate lyase